MCGGANGEDADEYKKGIKKGPNKKKNLIIRNTTHLLLEKKEKHLIIPDNLRASLTRHKR